MAISKPAELSTIAATYGACGSEGCDECLPLFDAANIPIPGTDHRDQQ